MDPQLDDLVDFGEDGEETEVVRVREETLVNDQRDAGHSERIRAVADDGGCHACHSQQGCTEWCPRHLSPTAGIMGLKRAAARALLTGRL